MTQNSDIKIAIFVISLKEATQRQAIVEKHLRQLDIPWEFFMVSRYSSDQRPADVVIDDSANLTNGEIGCFLSHRSLWQKIANSNLDYAIVLEDDTVLTPALDYRALFGNLIRLNVDFAYLFTLLLTKASHLVYLGEDLGHLIRVIKPKHGLGLAAYSLTPRAAGILFSASKIVDVPADIWIELSKNHGIHMCCHFPSIAVQIRSPSTIGKHSPEPSKTNFLAYLYQKILERIDDMVMQWQRSRMDQAVRVQADKIKPGSAAWPMSKLRQHVQNVTKHLLRD
ncbi:MAG: glycosyltransferase family 25 protein [Proteobacteria bacterium]|nr:glycosyltransferase family 25 protein [Pseudomonadota bacterium]